MTEYTFEISTFVTVEAKNEDEAIQKAWDEVEKEFANTGFSRFSMFYEDGKGV